MLWYFRGHDQHHPQKYSPVCAAGGGGWQRRVWGPAPHPGPRTCGSPGEHYVVMIMRMVTMMVEMLILARMAFMRPTLSSLTKAMFLTRWWMVLMVLTSAPSYLFLAAWPHLIRIRIWIDWVPFARVRKLISTFNLDELVTNYYFQYNLGQYPQYYPQQQQVKYLLNVRFLSWCYIDLSWEKKS